MLRAENQEHEISLAWYVNNVCCRAQQRAKIASFFSEIFKGHDPNAKDMQCSYLPGQIISLTFLIALSYTTFQFALYLNSLMFL